MAKFMRKGKTKVFFLTAIASSLLKPTVAELAAGETLHDKDLTDINGFTFEAQTVDAPVFASRQTPKIAGEDQTADSSMRFWEDDTSNPLRDILAKDETGFVVIAPAGAITAGSEVDVFPVRVSSNPRQYSSGNEPASWTANFAIDDIAAQDVAILA